jgi:iron complex outermembrane receptor protein
VFRNLGTVTKWGIDGSVAYNPIRELTIYAFGSWNDSSIHDNIQTGLLPVGVTCDNVAPNSIDGRRACAFTEGNRESGTPKYTYGLSGLGTVGPVDLGITAKRTGPRFIFDNGAAMFRGDIGITTATPGRVVEEQVFGKTAPAYWLVNLDARLNLDKLGITALGMKHTYFQLNVYNLFDKFMRRRFRRRPGTVDFDPTCNATPGPSARRRSRSDLGCATVRLDGAPRTVWNIEHRF